MEWWKIAIIAAVVIAVLFLVVCVILMERNNEVESDCIWSGKKRTLFGLPLSFTTYILTETKFIIRKGLFSLCEDEFDLYKLMDKQLRLPFAERLFGCGTIVLTVRNNNHPNETIKSIKEPRKVLKLIDAAAEKERDKYRVKGRDIIGLNMPDHDCDCDVCDDDNN